MENISEVDWQLRLDQFQDDLALAQKKHSTSLATYSKKPGDIDERIIFYMNATTRLCIDVARAAERMGAIGAVEQMREQMRKKILEFWHEAPKIDLGVAGDRIAAVSVAYSDDVRWSLAGSGSMVNALWFAAWHEFGNAVALDVDYADQCAQTIAKSLSRLRQRIRGESGVRFDPVSLQFEMYDLSSDLFSDLPSGRGRPAKPK